MAAKVHRSPPVATILRLPEAGRSAVGQASLRQHNLSLVLREIVDAPIPMSRAEIAKTTGLTKAAVSALVDLLIDARMIEELDRTLGERAGRPAVPLAPARHGMLGLGLGVQLDHFGARVIDLSGNVLQERIVHGNFRASDPPTVLARLAELADRLLAQLTRDGAAIAGVGLSIPGTVQTRGRLVHYAPNLDWRDLDILAMLAEHSQLAGAPVLLGNDADLAARAEARARARARGVPRDEESFLYVTCEVGLGGAIVVRGELTDSWSGDIGHMAVDRAGPPCGCGARGCLEQYAGRDSMMIRAGLGVESSIDDLQAAVTAGERAPGLAVSEAAEALGVVISSALNLVTLDTVVLGGAYAHLADLLIPTIERHINRRTIASRWTPIRVHAGLSGDLAPLTGAALAAVDEVVNNPSALLSLA